MIPIQSSEQTTENRDPDRSTADKRSSCREKYDHAVIESGLIAKDHLMLTRQQDQQRQRHNQPKACARARYRRQQYTDRN
jgi:hypothetical protein